MPEQTDQSPQFEGLLEYMKASRGFDFTGYKRPSLRRRIDKRMREQNLDVYDEYVDFLEANPDEFVTLFNSILINVTSFYRDAPTWVYLQEEVLPRHLDRLPDKHPIRIWSAGCATGEEAYTLAIILAEILGIDEFTRRVKIYGTDVDEDALSVARAAMYSDAETSGLPDELRDRYFESTNGRLTFRSDLRRAVIFGRLDILTDAPISRLELLTCRNTLMYFNASTQSQVIERLHFALNDNAVMMLGKAETLLSHSELFAPIDRRRRIFSKVPTHRRAREMFERYPINGDGNRPATNVPQPYTAAFQALPTATLLFNADGVLVDANEATRHFGVTRQQVGQLLQDLDISYRPVDLRTPVTHAFSDRRIQHLPAVSWNVEGSPKLFDIDVVPLYDGPQVLGACVYFNDRTQLRELEERLQVSTLELEQAYQEVQSANEELETTNEELQSTIEELETTNEELQSTNEELETMNEELHSTNDELHSVNEEARIRGDEVDQLNHFLQAIFTSLRGGVVVVDADRRVRVWNARSQDLWGLREDEVRGTDFLTVDIGLPVAELAPTLGKTIGGEPNNEVVVDAITRRGRSIRCRVAMTALLAGQEVDGAILVMEPLEN